MKINLVLSLKNILVILFLGIGCISYAQSEDSGNDSYILLKKRKLVLGLDDKTGEVQITEFNTLKTAFKGDFKQFAEDRVTYSKFEKIKEFEVNTIVPFKTKTKTKKLESFSRVDVLNNGIFYSGYRAIDFRYPEVNSNTTGNLSYQRSISDPHMVRLFDFAQYHLSAEKVVYEIETDKRIRMRNRLFGMEKGSYSYTIDSTTTTYIYQWTMNHVEAIKSERRAPSSSYFEPHIITMVESINERSISQSIDDLYKWYSSLIDEIPEEEPEERKRLQSFVDQLVNEIKSKNPKASEDELRELKMRGIYNWVRRNVKYIAFEAGMEGFIPRNAYQVYEKRYGDCKDVSNLLKTMLNMAQLEGALAWIGTRAKPYKYEDVPCVYTDNHMICYAGTFNNKPLFLDATDPDVPFSYPTAFIQGKQALVQTDKTNYDLVQVDVIKPRQNLRLDSLNLVLLDGKLVGDIMVKTTGYASEPYTRLYLKTGAELTEEQSREIDLGYPMSYGKLNFSHSSTNEDPILQGFVVGEEALLTSDDKLYVNLSLLNLGLGQKIKIAERQYPIEQKYKKQIESITRFVIPTTYSTEYIPKSSLIEYDSFTYSCSYEKVNNTIIRKEKLVLDFLLLPKDQFSDWNRFLALIRAYRKEVVVLKSSNE